MNSQPKSMRLNETQVMLTYICRIICRYEIHIQSKCHACYKHHIPLFECKICKNIHTGSSYRCANCNGRFCVLHFIDHSILFDKCRINEVVGTCKFSYLKINKTAIKPTPFHLFHKIACNLDTANLKISITHTALKEGSLFNELLKAKNLKHLGKALKRNYCQSILA